LSPERPQHAEIIADQRIVQGKVVVLVSHEAGSATAGKCRRI
jgi:hypothetical protein